MKSTVWTAMMTMAMAVCPAAFAAKGSAPAAHRVIVCSDIPSMEFSAAMMRASLMFARISVKLEWRAPQACQEGALRISLSSGTPREVHPGALGYALPYEGTHIVVLWDRVKASVPKHWETALLTYVIVHEITHILEGECRHSATGLMKAHWTTDDFSDMSRAQVQFAAEDVELIHAGLARREAPAAAPAAAPVV
jgi:hypothetical protein